jgi:hypothetical protein
VALREESRVAHRRTKKVAWRCSSFGDGGVEGGDDDVEGGSPAHEEGGGDAKVGQPDGANQGTPRLGFRVGGVTPLIPGHFWYRLT